VELKFSDPLDSKTATDPESYGVERWNYYWSSNYGSKHYSVSERGAVKQDKLTVTAARLSADGRTVALDIADMRPSDQLHIQVNVDGADGALVNREIYATVPVLEAVGQK